ncbi:DUF421 domain-containing protein [Actinomarinicola tropica]|uniref:DUF421 domain-containing protein n=1 Tax=Actinomarinicola tropica TaxID=2789776 RepID=A0A5Q2RJD7_9ACTN|nr:YetF domain-containing protein [Actinomarinicola tropica]QGG93950.1 DUF421 domain-containing protein [Actinomarinicola tropica]
MSEWFGSSWSTIGWVAASTVAMYATLLVTVRIAGRRTVAQLSAFDAVITISFGTLLASTALAPDPSYVQGTTALLTLLALQVGVAFVRRRSALARRLLEFEPETVVDDGRATLPTGLFTSQLSEGELRSRLREKGHHDLSGLMVVVLEPDGGISVRTDE